jgi:hypothetical protein
LRRLGGAFQIGDGHCGLLDNPVGSLPGIGRSGPALSGRPGLFDSIGWDLSITGIS